MTPGQLSADGRWQWDGAKWVPAPAGTALVTQSTYPPYAFVQPAPTNALAVTSLVLGILSWFLCPLAGSIGALVCGYVAKSQIRTSGESGSGLATAGLALGYVNLGFSALFVLFWLFLFGGFVALFGAAATSGH